MVKLKLFGYEMKEKSEYIIFFNNKPELLLFSLYYFSTRFSFIKTPIQDMLNELEDMLNEIMKKELPSRIAYKFEAFQELLSIITTSINDFFSSVNHYNTIETSSRYCIY